MDQQKSLGPYPSSRRGRRARGHRPRVGASFGLSLAGREAGGAGPGLPADFARSDQSKRSELACFTKCKGRYGVTGNQENAFRF